MSKHTLFSWCSAGFGFMATIALCAVSPPVLSHGLNTSYTTLTLTPQALAVTVTFNLSDLPAHVLLDLDGNQAVSPQEMAAALPLIFAMCESDMAISFEGRPMVFDRDGHAVRTDASGQEWLDVRFKRALSGLPQQVALTLNNAFFERFGQDHTHLLSLYAGGENRQAVLSISESEARFSIDTPPSR